MAGYAKDPPEILSFRWYDDDEEGRPPFYEAELRWKGKRVPFRKMELKWIDGGHTPQLTFNLEGEFAPTVDFDTEEVAQLIRDMQKYGVQFVGLPEHLQDKLLYW